MFTEKKMILRYFFIGLCCFFCFLDSNVFARGEDFLTVTPPVQEVTEEGGTFKFYVESNASWTVVNTNSWITMDKLDGISYDTLTAVVAMNAGLDGRAGSVVITTSGGVEQTILITQDAALPYIGITASTSGVVASGDNVSFTIESNMDWTISSSASWFTLNTTSGSGNAILTGVAAPNTTTNIRSVEVVLTSNGLIQIINIAQSAAATGTSVPISAKVFLQGAYDATTGLMRDDLRKKNYIPTQQPYGSTSYSDFAYTGTETVSSAVLAISTNMAVVDWVLLEMRDATTPSTVKARRAALLLRNGNIVDIDGASPVNFDGLDNTKTYYVSVRHRNHLGVMTKSPITLSTTTTPTFVDFTQTTLATYKRTDATGSNYAQRAYTSQSKTVQMMWRGNVSKDNKLVFQGSSNDIAALQFMILTDTGNTKNASNYIINGYSRADVNMNGQAVFQGSGSDTDLISFNVLAFPGNTSQVSNFIVYEQLP